MILYMGCAYALGGVITLAIVLITTPAIVLLAGLIEDWAQEQTLARKVRATYVYVSAFWFVIAPLYGVTYWLATR